jgi:hypothetical protein
MRPLLLAIVTFPTLVGVPAFAQTVQPGPGKVVTGPPGLPSVEPVSRHASNITPNDTRSVIAPALPSSDLGPGATALDYLRAAESALASNQTGQAQAALENAETLLLTRSVPLGATSSPDRNPAVRNINTALQSLGSNDPQRAMNIVRRTIRMTQQAEMGRPPMAPATAQP